MTDLHPKRLLGKGVVVTGAARGQGAAEAEALTRKGARVIATDATRARKRSPSWPAHPSSTPRSPSA